jgi:hypothetical protein
VGSQRQLVSHWKSAERVHAARAITKGESGDKNKFPDFSRFCLFLDVPATVGTNHWTEAEEKEFLALWKAGATNAEIAMRFARSTRAIKQKRRQLDLPPRVSLPASSTDEIQDDGFRGYRQMDDLPQPGVPRRNPSPVGDARLQQAALEIDLARERRRAATQRSAGRWELLERDFFQSLREELLQHPVSSIRVRPPDVSARDKNLSAVLLLSDTHIGKIVRADQTDDLGSYSPLTYLARLDYLIRTVVDDVGASGVLPVRELHVLLLGDLVEGLLEHGTEREEKLLMVEQFSVAAYTLFEALLRLCAAVPRVHVYGVCGNHGRWPSQRRMPTENRHSNFDSLVYSALQAMTTAANVPNLVFDLRTESRQIIEVGRFRIHAQHGDEIRGGDLPLRGIQSEVYHSTLRRVMNGRGRIDYWVLGHLHRSATLPLGDGNVVINGSFVGLDSYAMRFAPTVASQTLFWLEDEGKTLQRELRLQAAPIPTELPFSIPQHLRPIFETDLARVPSAA